MGISYQNVAGVGPSPDPRSLRFRFWALALRQWRYLECPISRTTTYYFSTTGSDAADGLTTSTPKQTKLEAQALIDAAPDPADIAILFKRGDEWTDSDVLTLNKANITIGAYSTTTGNRPWFSRFSLKYTASGWTLAAGNRYTRAEASRVGSVRYQGYENSKSTSLVLSRQTSQADCEATSNSWYWAASVLHVNIGGTDPNTLNLEANVANTDSGILIDSDGCRVDNIRVDGWGCDPANPHSPQAYQIKTRVSGTDSAVVSNCEGYYGGTHMMGHYTSTGGGAGGIIMFDNCIAGFNTRNVASGETCFNTYAPQGGQETIFWNCTAAAGTLPTGTAAWTILCDSHFGHGGDLVAFILTWFDPGVPSIIPSAYGCKVGAHYDIASLPGVSSDVTTVRCWIVGENFSGSGSTCPLPWNSATLHAYINCQYDLIPANLSSSAITSAGAANQTFEGWQINNVWKIDLTNQAGAGAIGMFNALGTINSVKFWHCSILIIPTDNTFRLDLDSFSSDSSPTSEMKNTVYTAYPVTGGNVVYVGLNNDAAYQRNNAYAGITGRTGTVNRYDYGNAVNKVQLDGFLRNYALNSYDNGLLSAGDPNVGVEYDLYWRKRDSGAPTIGAVEQGPLYACVPTGRSRLLMGVR